MTHRLLSALLILLGCLLFNACSRQEGGSAEKPLAVGIAFETLQTEYWIAGFDAIKAEARARGASVLEAVADGDTHRQLEQVRNFITRKVDGIILVPKDAQTCLPMIRAANAAKIPIVLFNRPADKSDAHSVAVVANNQMLAQETVAYLVSEARKTGRKHKAMILIGDLGDMNAIGRRDGFEAALEDG